MKENLKKHSVMILGHATSITLENEFWDELQIIAMQRNTSVNALITEVDTKKAPEINLSSALRVYILKSVKERVH